MAGLVWNAPLSCAWAGRVYVSNREARDHGLGHVGLPSRLASFEGVAAPSAVAAAAASGGRGGKKAAAAAAAAAERSWWRKGRPREQALAAQQSPAAAAAAAAGLGVTLSGGWLDAVQLRNLERGRRGLAAPVATLKLPPLPAGGWPGPRMRLSLPSFSGGTPEHPGLLKYSCDLRTNVLPVAPMSIQLHNSGDGSSGGEAAATASGSGSGSTEKRRKWWLQGRLPQQQRRRQKGEQRDGGESLDALLSGPPLVALSFGDMVMKVEAPVKLPAADAAPAVATARRGAVLATVPPRL